MRTYVTFRVIDSRTNKEPTREELRELVLDQSEDNWAKGLIWNKVVGWYVDRDGCPILADSCGNFVYAPSYYQVVWVIELYPDT